MQAVAPVITQVARAGEGHKERHASVSGHIAVALQRAGRLASVPRHPLPQQVVVERVARSEGQATEGARVGIAVRVVGRARTSTARNGPATDEDHLVGGVQLLEVGEESARERLRARAVRQFRHARVRLEDAPTVRLGVWKVARQSAHQKLHELRV
eukprot:7000781-Prymnesium_polylepis.1